MTPEVIALQCRGVDVIDYAFIIATSIGLWFAMASPFTS